MGLFNRLFARNDRHVEIDLGDLLANDDYDMVPEEPADPDFKLAGMRVGIVYKDRGGARTRRIIRLKRLDASDDFSFVHAWCELRSEDRTFDVQAIETLYDPATGEILPGPEQFFGPYIDAQIEIDELAHDKQRYRLAWPLIEAIRFELQVLVLIARADGRFVKAEQEMLLRYSSARGTDLGLSVDDEALVVLRGWLKVQDPSEPEARIALRALKDTPGALDNIWEVSELVAEADGKLRPEERASIAVVRKAIGDLLSTTA